MNKCLLLLLLGIALPAFAAPRPPALRPDLAPHSPVATAQISSVHSTSLWWSASPDATAANPGSVNVYRATQACPASGTSGVTFAKVASGEPGSNTKATAYVDTAVSSGQTYCYYVTAVIGGAESAPSNTFSGTIPVAAPSLSGVVQ